MTEGSFRASMRATKATVNSKTAIINVFIDNGKRTLCNVREVACCDEPTAPKSLQL